MLATLPLSTSKLDIVFVGDSTYASGLKDAFIANFPGRSRSRSLQRRRHRRHERRRRRSPPPTRPAYALLIADFDAPPLMAAVAKASGLGMTQFLMTDSAKKPSLWGQLGGVYTVMSRVRGTGARQSRFNDPSGKAFAVLADQLQERVRGEDPAETAFVANAYDAFYAAAFAALSLPGATS